MMFRSLIIKILGVVFAVSAISLGTLGTGTYFLMNENLQKNLEGSLREIGKENILAIDGFLTEKAEKVRLLTDLNTLNAASVSILLRNDPDLSWVGVINSSGNRIRLAVSSGRLLVFHGQSETEMFQSWISKAAGRSKTIIDTDPEEGEDRNRFIVFIFRIQNSDEYLAAQLPLDSVISLVDRVRVGETGRSTLFNAKGILIGHQNRSRIGYDMSKYPILKEPVEQGKGNPGDVFLSGDGREKWGMTMILPELKEKYGLQWGIIVDQTIKELYQPVSDLLRVLILYSAVAFTVSAIIGLLFSLGLVSPVKKVLSGLQEIASGKADISKRLKVRGNDEIALLAGSFNKAMDRIAAMVDTVIQISENLVTAAEQMAGLSAKSFEFAEAQKKDTEIIASSVHEMNVNAQGIASDASEAVAAATQGRAVSTKSGDTLGQANESIQKLAGDVIGAAVRVEELSDLTGKIASIVEIIADIANQTNLLALNAAIEAARAGGRTGFAVVADEVRTLAQKTRESTERIQETILLLKGAVQDSVNLMKENRIRAEESSKDTASLQEALTQIKTSIEVIYDKNSHIADASNEQSTVTSEINKNISSISVMAQKTVSSLEQISVLSRKLDDMAHALQSQVGGFKKKS